MANNDFKINWQKGDLDEWFDFEELEIDKTNLSSLTKEFLKNGFPENPSPYLGFGLRSFDNKFYTISEYYTDYELSNGYQNYWIFGSDGSGNIICIDSNQNDRIVILDHEENFGIFQIMNKDIIELSKCLLEYKNFIEEIQNEFGEDGFIESKFTEVHLDKLKVNFIKINPNIFEESDFWDSEIDNLYCEIK
ncbi:SUKH-4 family immunity protein [Flavobacterium sp. F-328]|uniref:SUKH-4 family immunity protein n=1 Tax=Flavobacterium erciyesense TaxID=2825842 RepID=A0ABS5D7I7_9FLAO|nr:SUKH-4 family immunity protein [Flavobacterium erciyesense]MBQ0910011.1 SUKH-4 family immunity protein [Flavobacterium erciyesense]